MFRNRMFKVLACLILLLVIVLPAGTALASGQPGLKNIANAQSAFSKYAPGSGASIQSATVTFAWGTSSGATQYQYCYDTINNNVCDSSWTYAGTNNYGASGTLSNNTTYYWQARAVGPSGTIEASGGTWWSFSVSLVTPTPTPLPFAKAMPANGATGQSTSTAFAWNSSSGAVRYEYCHDTINNGVCDTSWISNGTSQYIYLSSFAYSTTYSWQVRAVDASNVIKYANGGEWWTFTTMAAPTPTRTRTSTPSPTTSPAFIKYAPGNGTSISSATVTFAWGTSSGATRYEYCYDTINNNVCDVSWTSAGTNAYGPSGTLSNNTTYYWQARAVGTSGTTEANGGTWWSFSVSLVTPTSTPAPFGKTIPANGAAWPSGSPLAWNANSGAVRYEYCYDTSNNNTCNATWISTGTSQCAFMSGLISGTSYSWQVRAVDANGVITYANGGVWWVFSVN